jgi:hypothetical protein
VWRGARHLGGWSVYNCSGRSSSFLYQVTSSRGSSGVSSVWRFSGGGDSVAASCGRRGRLLFLRLGDAERVRGIATRNPRLVLFQLCSEMQRAAGFRRLFCGLHLFSGDGVRYNVGFGVGVGVFPLAMVEDVSFLFLRLCARGKITPGGGWLYRAAG